MGRPLWLMSGCTSGWENKRVLVWDDHSRFARWSQVHILSMTEPGGVDGVVSNWTMMSSGAGGGSAGGRVMSGVA